MNDDRREKESTGFDKWALVASPLRVCCRGLVLLALTELLLPKAAAAYVDPGTGGLLIQLLTGGIAGALVILKLYWSKVARLFQRRKKEDDPTVDA